jgi:AcrR family transcriptional regulator
MISSSQEIPATVGAGWRHFAPQQDRGVRTQERIVDAVEKLLEDRPFSAISIAEIVGEADTTSGSFYARFESKEAILPFIYRRYHQLLNDEMEQATAEIDWESLDLRAAIAALVDLVTKLPERRPWLMRTVFLFARQHPEALPKTGDRSRLVRGLLERALAPHRHAIRRSDFDRAQLFLSFVIATAARERLLFPGAPLAAALPHDEGEFEGDLVELMYAYLTTVDSTEKGR